MTYQDHAAELLVGKTIKTVSYMTDVEQSLNLWSKKALVIEFTDGSFMYPMSDDEGNDAGALTVVTGDDSQTIGTL